MRILTRIVDWFATPYSLYLLLKDPQISWKTKLKAGLILAAVSLYILNPMDIIPDFTPFLGWLDDLVIVPAVMYIGGKAVPEVSLAEIRHKARSRTWRVIFWTAAAVTVLILLGLSIIGLAVYFAVNG